MIRLGDRGHRGPYDAVPDPPRLTNPFGPPGTPTRERDHGKGLRIPDPELFGLPHLLGATVVEPGEREAARREAGQLLCAYGVFVVGVQNIGRCVDKDRQLGVQGQYFRRRPRVRGPEIADGRAELVGRVAHIEHLGTVGRHQNADHAAGPDSETTQLAGHAVHRVGELPRRHIPSSPVQRGPFQAGCQHRHHLGDVAALFRLPVVRIRHAHLDSVRDAPEQGPLSSTDARQLPHG